MDFSPFSITEEHLMCQIHINSSSHLLSHYRLIQLHTTSLFADELIRNHAACPGNIVLYIVTVHVVSCL